MSAESGWETTQTLLKQLKDAFDSDVDVKTVQSVGELTEEIRQLYSSHHTDVKDALNGLIGQVEDARNAAEIQAVAEKYSAQLEGLQARRDQLNTQLAELSHRQSVEESDIAALRAEAASIREGMTTIEAQETEEIPFIKHAMSLYASVSHIRWNFESEFVEGFVAPPGTAPKPFKLDPKTTSDFDIAENLWSLIES